MGITHATTPSHPNNPDYDVSYNAWTEDHAVPASGFALGAGGPSISAGSDDPEGSVTAEPGSIYLRTTGTFYVKTTGSGDTGWLEVVVTQFSP